MTPLGAVATWPQSLRTTVDNMLASRHATMLAWGPELTVLYNDAWASFMGDRHPADLGRPLREAWPAMWDDIAPAVDRVLAGETTGFEHELPITARDGQPERPWTFSCSPVRDEGGTVAGLLVVLGDTAAQVRAGQALRESEERYRSLFEAMGQGYAEFEMIRDGEGQAVDIRYIEMNPQYEQLTGISVAEARGRTVREMIPGYDSARVQDYDRIARSGRPGRIESEVAALGRWYEANVYPRGDDRLSVRFDDITVRKRAEAALRESEERQRLMVELVPALLWSVSPDGREVSLNERWLAYTGQTTSETQDHGWFQAIHPDDLPATRAAFERAFRAGEPLERQQRIRQRDGAYRWHLIRQIPIFDAAGGVVRWFGAAIDVHDMHELQRHQRLLVAELQHRVRNILTVTRLTFSRTFEQGGSLDEMASHFRGRLDAMGRMQVVLSRDAARTADLEDMLRDELVGIGASEDSGVTIAGPDVELDHKTAEALGMALHELATNALKYGALKGDDGTLDISWAINMGEGGGRTLDLVWRERGVPAVSMSPARPGFGRELIEEALPYQLKAKTSLTFMADGMRCTISIPLGVGQGG